MQYRVTGGSLNHRLSGLGLLRSLADYTLRSKGPLTHSAHEVGGFVKTRPELDRPDAQIGVGLYSMSVSGQTVAIDAQPGITIGGYFTRPESRGTVQIRSADPLFRWIRRLARQPALAPWLISETTPGEAFQTDEQIIEAFLRYGSTAYHVCGTVRMGSGDDAPLDPQLRLRGVENLRVADTSIMPTLISGNTNAPAMVIGLRAAELIRQARAGLAHAA
jgi:choline dehydrogenase-like flavoprotein